MINSRTKGRAGEQEVANILRNELGIAVHRNWAQQAAIGGCDLIGIPGWAIEVKRTKKGSDADISSWWQQAAQQANDAGKLKPALVYRFDRHDWKARISLHDLRPDLGDHAQVTLDLQSWIGLVREDLNADARELPPT